MEIAPSYAEGRLTVYLRGELDQHEAKPAVERIERELDKFMPRDCVLDIGSLSFIDSSGIAVILRICARMKSTGGRAWVQNAKSQPLKVIDISGIGRLVKINEAEAAQ
ncbi:MAG: anti-sigma factor antagonist [Oscillospiraceae bacterium]|nr:anti-sigma factor antagonist [Oscillospiraceae bacterium]